VNEDVVNIVSTGGGDDTVYLGGGYNKAIGGTGVDTFHIASEAQNTKIYGDLNGNSSIYSNANATLNQDASGSGGTDFGDAVHLGWLKSEITLAQRGEGYFRIEHAGTGSVIDLYDVEELYFSDGEYKALTEGRVIGGDDWIGDAAGMDIEYEQHNVSFQVDGNMLRVLASATVEVTEEQFDTYSVWDYSGTMYSELDYPGVDWASYGAVLSHEEQISLGVQTFEKELDGVVIWEGPRSEVDAFAFADDVSINVINVSSEDIAGNAVFDTVGTEGIDLIFGSAGDDMIDGKGGDDIIFGGEGDDVIIGGDGDDVIIGGDGADILRGDGVNRNDAAVAAWKAAAGEFNSANPDNATVFDENMLSLDNGGQSAGNGDDVIIGGDGLDDIKSGDGRNFVTSGKADIDGDGQANLDLINQNIDNHQHLLDDEDWV
jgi:Ca2+-binding RTX toxin-like protein